MTPPTASGRISGERFKRWSRNFTRLSGTACLINLPDMTSRAASNRLQNGIKYCKKVRITGATGTQFAKFVLKIPPKVHIQKWKRRQLMEAFSRTIHQGRFPWTPFPLLFTGFQITPMGRDYLYLSDSRGTSHFKLEITYLLACLLKN